jgi:site-specific recombinase XerD
MYSEVIFLYEKIFEFEKELLKREKSRATIEKYIRDVRAFLKRCKGVLTEEGVLKYKSYLCEKYRPRSVNSMISSINCYLDFIGRGECKVKALKMQRRTFSDVDRELTRAEYERLLEASEKNDRMYFLLQTICSTGIRVSEVKFITVEALKYGCANIEMKGKTRTILMPKKLCRALLKYAKSKKITSGAVFITKCGNPLDRSNIWSDMKKLCDKAQVDKKKVFPHNLRHLFARVYYSREKDIVRLADILGHSSINTTRIYTMESGDIHRRQLEKLGLLRC